MNMMRNFSNSFLLLFFLLWLVPCLVIASRSDPHTLVLGKISHNPKKHYRYLKPMLMYVVERMSDQGVRKGKIRMAKSKEQMAQFLAGGEVDWVTETPVAASYLHENSGAELLLKKWKKGVPEYYPLFFSLKHGQVKKLDDLKGRIIALEDPASTSAYYLPVHAMIQRGLKPIKLKSFRESPPADRVGFVFVREEINISILVNKGLADAGAFSNLDWDKEDHLPSRYRDQFSVFHILPPVIRAVELVRPDFDPVLKSRLETILLRAENDPKAQPVLHAYQETKKFEKLNDPQKQLIYDLYPIVQRVDDAISP
jgi:phosphonate transport system substrate-binding protein